MDLSQLTHGYQPVTLAGRTFDARLLKLHEWGDVQCWLKTAVPSPIAEAVRALQGLKALGETVDADVRQSILDHAQEAARKWPPRVGSIPWIQALSETEGGTARFIRVALDAAGECIDEAEALELEAEASVDEVADLIRVCLHGEKPLPKATTAPTEAAPDTVIWTLKRTIGASSSSESSPIPDGPTETLAS